MTKLQSLYRQMLRMRKIEQAIADEYKNQEMRCPVHLSIGQEAAAVGLCEWLTKDDLMVSTHRGHYHYLAKGGSLRGLLCELYGKADGCGRGQAGSMHLSSNDEGFDGSTSIVAGTVAIGVGLAFAKKLKKEPGLVVVCMGDAVVEEGVFHESANFASLHNLPVVFFLENNLYSCFTHIDQRQPQRGFDRIAMAHDISYFEGHGNNVWDVSSLCAEAISTIRKTPHPLMVCFNTYRHLEHCGPANDDHLGYRDKGEIAFWIEEDPIKITEEKLHSLGEWTAEFVDSLAAIDEEIRAEMLYAQKAPPPDIEELGAYTYATKHWQD